MLSDATAYLASRVSRVEVPLPGVPDAPDADKVVDGTKDGTEWVAGLSPSFWTIIIVLVAAYLVMRWLKNPVIKGAAIMLVLVMIGAAIVK